jgi:hypothetical protein
VDVDRRTRRGCLVDLALPYGEPRSAGTSPKGRSGPVDRAQHRAEVNGLLAGRGTTFLRRADRRKLGRIDRDEVLRALQIPIERAGHHISAGALDVAVDGTGGYPFMIQLVGLHTWRVARSSDHIEVHHAEQGVLRARRKVGELVHASAIADLSDKDRQFLRAMAVDDGPSRMRDIGQRMGRDENYVSQYRLRLIDTEMIAEAGHGLVAFTLPGLRDYLRSEASRQVWGDDVPDVGGTAQVHEQRQPPRPPAGGTRGGPSL